MLKGAIFDLEILLTEKIHQWLKSMGYFLEQIRASFLGFKKESKMLGITRLNFPIVYCSLCGDFNWFLIWFCLFVKKSRSYLARTKREKNIWNYVDWYHIGRTRTTPTCKISISIIIYVSITTTIKGRMPRVFSWRNF